MTFWEDRLSARSANFSDEFQTYLLKFLPSYRAQYSDPEELFKLLTDFNFLQSKLDLLGIQPIIDDYELVKNEDLLIIKEALLLSSHFVSKDKFQLASQLLARLPSAGSPLVQNLREQAERWDATTWLRPLVPTLTQTGGALIRTLHVAGISTAALAISDDGEFFIIASEHALRLWRIKSGAETFVFNGHSDSVTCIEVFDQGRRAISGSKDMTLIVWDTKIGSYLYTLQGHKSAVTSVAVWGNDRYAVSDSEDGEIILWHLESRQSVFTFARVPSKASQLKVTEEGKCIINAWVPKGGEDSSDSRNILAVWDMAKRVEMYAMEARSGWFRLISGGRLIVRDLENDDCMVYDLQTGANVGRLKGDLLWSSITGQESLTVFGDGKHALSVTYAGLQGSRYYLEIYVIEENERLYSLPCHATGSFAAIKLTPDDRLAVSATVEGEIKIWDIDRILHQFSEKTPREMALSMLRKESLHMDEYAYEELQRLQDRVTVDWFRQLAQKGRNAYKPMLPIERADDSSAHLREELLEIKRKRLAVVLFYPHTEVVNALVVTPDGKQVLSVSDDGLMKIWDIETKTICRSIVTIGDMRCMALTPDGENAVSSHDEIIKVRDLGQRKFLYRLCDLIESRFLIRVYLIALLDMLGYPVLRKLTGHSGDVFCVTVTNDGQHVISGSVDKTVKVWNLKKGKLLRTLEGHKDTVSCIALTPDDSFVISGSVDCTIRLWDWKSGRLVRTIEAHSQPVVSLVVTPDGEQFISSAKDGTVKIWHLNSALEPQVLARAEPQAWFSSLSVFSHASLLATASVEGKVIVFDLRSRKILAQFYGEHGFSACAITPDGKIIIAGDVTGKIHFLGYIEGQGLVAL